MAGGPRTQARSACQSRLGPGVDADADSGSEDAPSAAQGGEDRLGSEGGLVKTLRGCRHEHFSNVRASLLLQESSTQGFVKPGRQLA
jgi:hypothetical protein